MIKEENSLHGLEIKATYILGAVHAGIEKENVAFQANDYLQDIMVNLNRLWEENEKLKAEIKHLNLGVKS